MSNKRAFIRLRRSELEQLLDLKDGLQITGEIDANSRAENQELLIGISGDGLYEVSEKGHPPCMSFNEVSKIFVH